MTSPFITLEIIINLALGIPIGLVSGLYTGLIITRYTRFAELRNEAMRIIRATDFMQNDTRINLSNDHDVSKLVLVGSDLLFLGHRKAGEATMKLSTEISNINYAARHGKVDVDEYSKHFGRWQDIGRDLPSSKKVLWSLWGRI